MLGPMKRIFAWSPTQRQKILMLFCRKWCDGIFTNIPIKRTTGIHVVFLFWAPRIHVLFLTLLALLPLVTRAALLVVRAVLMVSRILLQLCFVAGEVPPTLKHLSFTVWFCSMHYPGGVLLWTARGSCALNCKWKYRMSVQSSFWSSPSSPTHTVLEGYQEMWTNKNNLWCKENLRKKLRRNYKIIAHFLNITTRDTHTHVHTLMCTLTRAHSHTHTHTPQPLFSKMIFI